MAIAIPGTWTYEGPNGQDETVFSVTGHTTTENFFVKFLRRYPSVANGLFTKPYWKMRVTRSFVDTDGVPFSQKAQGEFSITWPSAATAADIKAMVAEFATILSDASAQADIVDTMTIPRA
jgi:hypothetical protein